MLELYYWTTPNGHKITILLEELGLDYEIKPVNIGKGEQFEEAFLKISPNNKIPALLDHDPEGSNEPLAIFESGAIMLYLAEKTGRFLPGAGAARYDTLQWLFWQMASLGPMLGQNHHFSNYAPEKIPYAIERYRKESTRLYRVLDRRLANQDYMAGDYGIADMATYPWILPDNQGQNIDEFPDLKAWLGRVGERPAVQRAYARAETVNRDKGMSEEAKKILFGQDDTRAPGN